MTSITKNHKTSTALVITVVAAFLAATTGSLHVVLAADNVNVQTEINQKEYCKTDRPNSPISDLCTARFSNTIIQSGRSEDTNSETAPASTSASTSTHTNTDRSIATHHATHPTVLTLNIAPNPVVRGQVVTVSGLLVNTLSSSGVGGATIKFTGPLGKLVTSPDGSFSTSFTAKAGTSTIQAHYAGAGTYEPSDSVKITLFVT